MRNMDKTNHRRNLLLQMAVFALFCLAFFVCGMYFFFWQPLQVGGDLDWQYLFFTLIFMGTVIFMLLFFRQSLQILSREMEKRLKMQKKHLEQLNRMCEGVLKALNYALDYRDHETWGHSARVVGYAVALGRQIGLTSKELTWLAWGSFLHDIGKIGIPDAILFKNSTLNREEWEKVKRHPLVGHEIINQIDFLQSTAEIILHHHEHYDGNGYPHALRGEEIPLPARVFAVADALDAMTSNRPYRPARLLDEALEEIKSRAGKQFCPRVVEALFSLGRERLEEIQNQVQVNGDIAVIRKELGQFHIVN